MVCYHTTTPDRVEQILREGLLPGSPPNWFTTPAPYVMLSPEPWEDLYGEESVVLRVEDPAILEEYFEDPEGLRWGRPISSKFVSRF